MADKVQKIRNEVERLQNELIQEREKGYGSDADDACILELQNVLTYIDSLQKEPVSEDLEEAAKRYATEGDEISGLYIIDEEVEAFKVGAKWQKENLWKPADGDDLPEYDREVVVLINYNAQLNIHDEEYPTYRVGFGHRPNPNGWYGKNIETNEVTHYTPKLYNKGGWNAPDIAYWFDVELPKEIKL